MRITSPRQWPLGLLFLAIVGLIAVSMPLSAGADALQVPLHGDHAGRTFEHFDVECDDVIVAPGKVLWHFVLTGQPQGARLHAGGGDWAAILGAGGMAPADNPAQGVSHWYVTTDQSLATPASGASGIYATATSVMEQANLVVSHVCPGEPDGPRVTVTFTKVVCPAYSYIMGNARADHLDATGGNYVLFSNYTGDGNVHSFSPLPTKPVQPTVPEGCRAGTAQFQLRTTSGGAVAATVGVGAQVLSADLSAWLLAGNQLWVNEIVPAGQQFGALRCYTDALNGDNNEFIRLGVVPMCTGCQPPPIHCVAYNVQEVPGDDLVIIEKDWILDSGGTMPSMPFVGLIRVQAFSDGGDPYGDEVVCDAHADGRLVLTGQLALPCSVRVPAGGTYRVTETALPGFSATGLGTFEPGDSTFCEGVDGPMVRTQDRVVAADFGHCVRNDDIPRTTTTIFVPTEVRASIVLSKVVSGGPDPLPADLAFGFDVTCGTTVISVTLGAGATSAPLGSFPVGTECSIVETSLPTAPEGYDWVMVTELDIVLARTGENPFTFTNQLRVTEVAGEEEEAPVPETTVAPTVVEALPTTGTGGSVAMTAFAVVLVGTGLVLLARRRELVS